MSDWWSVLRRNSRVASATSLSLVAGTLVALAIAWPGQKAIEAHLNDGSVWINYRDKSYVGRLNPKVRSIDTIVVGANSDVFQDGTDVLQANASSVSYVNTANGTAGDQVQLGAGGVAYGGRVVATIGGAKHRVWRIAEGTAGSFSARTTPFVRGLSAGPNGSLAVSPEGSVAVLNPTVDEVTHVDTGGEPSRAFTVKGAGPSAQITLVGARAVVFDATSGRLYREGERVLRIAGSSEDARLQQAANDGEDVYVATSRALWRVPLGGGEARAIDSGHRGVPAAPAILDGAVHAAWRETGSRAYARHSLRDAEHPSRTRHGALDSVTTDADLVFRMNRDVIVLNDAFNGYAWLVQDRQIDVVKVWDPVRSKKKENVEADAKQAQRQDSNDPPDANDDDALGARSGQATILPVLLNDGDPNGDVLTIESAKLDSECPGCLEPVNNDSQLQFKASEPGSYAFTYTIDDGHGLQASARGQVKVSDDAANQAPKEYPGRLPETIHPAVVPGSTTSMFLLAPLYDPDGDPFGLDCGKVKFAGGKVVSCRSDGVVTLKADDGGGQPVVQFAVTDGEQSGPAERALEWTTPAKAMPETNADRVVVKAGESAIVRPLLNDRDPQGDGGLKLDGVSGDERGIEIGQPTVGGSFSVRAPVNAEPGPRYLRYRTHSGGSAEDLVRVDVIPPPEKGGANDVIAVKDDARMRPGRTTLVDVLANDYDRFGGTLVVASITPETGSGIKASVIGRRVVRLESSSAIEGTKRVSYRVSNGEQSADGQIVVTGERAGTNLPPRAVADDQITVKAGAIRSIDVLANDVDPDGDELMVSRAAAGPDGTWPAGGVAFAAGRKVRVRAPGEPGQYEATYTVRDPDGATGTGTIKIDVPDTAFAAETNRAPAPAPVTARAVKGGAIRIPLGLDGSDPDGDEVSFKTVSVPPQKGLVIESGQDWILYEAHTAGQDHFRATIVDALGQSGTIDVNIGVADANAENQPPAALDDQIAVRPGHRMSYDVLANDSDLDGDRLELEPKPLAVKDAEAEVDGRMVSLNVPKQSDGSPESRVVGYRITDGKGGVSDARLTVVADKNAPDYPPVAQDDAVTPGQMVDKSAGDVITVDVLKNDSDPDGTIEDLRLRSGDRGVSVASHKLKIKLSGTDRTVLYRISDRENDGYGFVYVPGVSTLQPSLKPNKEVRYRIGDKPERIDLADYVAVRPGHKPMLASFRVSRANGSPSGLVRKGESAAVFYQAKASDFQGAWTDSIAVRVKDDPDLSKARMAEVSIPVIVEPADNVDPTMLNTKVVVGTSDREPVTVDLEALSHDPNSGDRLRFKARAKRGDPVDASVKGEELSIRAKRGAASGSYPLAVTVSDGHGGRATATVTVQIIRSAAPAIALPGVITRHGKLGRPTTVDIAEYASVPDNRAIRVSSTKASGASARVTHAGSRISVTPAGSGGTVVVSYTVSASGLQSAVGKLVVDADAPPGQPGRPTAQALTPDSVRLAWTPATSEGGPITAYEIDGHGSPCGAETVCVVTGLKPGTPYAFKVRAKNASSADWGPFSLPSTPVVPTKQPDVMTGLTVANDPKGMDKQLTLRWVKPNDYGSAITKYEIMVNGKLTTTAAGGATTTTVTNLVNGTPYRFAIRAVNAAEGEPSTFSTETAPVIPFGVPLGGPTPTVASAKSGEGGGNEIDVSWTLNNTEYNGRPPTQLVLTRHGVDGGASQTFTLDGAERSLTDTGAKNGGGYSYTIQMVNPAGTGPAGEASEVLYPYGPAAAPSVSLAQDGDRQATLAVSSGDLNGGELVGYDWTSDAGGSGRIGPSESTVTGLANKPQRLTLVPVTQGKGSLASNGELAGDAAGVSVSPFGPPPTPSVSPSNGSDTVTVSWNAGENGRPIDHVEFRVSGAASDSGARSGGSGNWSATIGREKTVSVEIWSVDTEGQSSGHWSGQIASQPYARRVIVSNGGDTSLSKCGPSATTCNYVEVRLEDFPPGSYSYDLGSGWCSGFSGTCASSRPISANGSDKYYAASDGYGNVTARVSPGGQTGSANF